MIPQLGGILNTQYCFLFSHIFPTKESLQKAVDDLGFGLMLDPELDVEKGEGFSPCDLQGYEDVGFEIEIGTVDELFEDEDDEEFAEHIGKRNRYISMSWGGNYEDCLSVMIVTKALLRSFDAVTTYDCEEPDSESEIEAGIQECLKELKKS